MGVVNTKSTAVTNADSSQPRLATPSYLSRTNLMMSIGTVEVAAADSDTSVFRFVQLPSNAVIYRIELLNDAIAGGTDYDLGLYKIATDGGLAADQDVFGTTIDMSAARSLPLDAMFEVLGIEKIEYRLWELLGLSADSQTAYDVCLTGNTVGTGAGTLSVRVMWGV